MRILHLSPLDGDVAFACPATLRALSRSGHTVVDFSPDPGKGHRASCQSLGILSERGGLREALLEKWDIIISPDTLSGDPEHEAVARAVREEIGEEIWWRWALWSSLQNANMIHSFSGAELSQLQKNIHYFSAGGNLLRGRAEFLGAAAGHSWPGRPQFPFAEAFLVVRKRGNRWILENRHLLDPESPDKASLGEAK